MIFSPRAKSKSTKLTLLDPQPSCTWVSKSQPFDATLKGVHFQCVLSWEEWTCQPVKARNVKWDFTVRPANAVGLIVPNPPTANSDFFTIGPVTVNTTDCFPNQTQPPGVTIVWGGLGGEPITISYADEVTSFQLQYTAKLVTFSPNPGEATWPQMFSWP